MDIVRRYGIPGRRSQMSTDMLKLRHVYNHDPIFHSFVDAILSALMRGDLSIYEVRDGCTLAMNLYAERRPPEPITIPVPRGYRVIEEEKSDEDRDKRFGQGRDVT
jgi:hypothetical protein